MVCNTNYTKCARCIDYLPFFSKSNLHTGVGTVFHVNKLIHVLLHLFFLECLHLCRLQNGGCICSVVHHCDAQWLWRAKLQEEGFMRVTQIDFQVTQIHFQVWRKHREKQVLLHTYVVYEFTVYECHMPQNGRLYSCLLTVVIYVHFNASTFIIMIIKWWLWWGLVDLKSTSNKILNNENVVSHRFNGD